MARDLIRHGNFFRVFIDEVATPRSPSGSSSTCDSVITAPREQHGGGTWAGSSLRDNTATLAPEVGFLGGFPDDSASLMQLGDNTATLNVPERQFYDVLKGNASLAQSMQEQKDAIGCASTGEPREGHCVVALAGSLRDNTATLATATSSLEHSGDSMSFMQLTQEQTAAIRWARVEQAVQHKQSIYDVANFAIPNFVKRDMLQRWIRDMNQGPVDEEIVMLAVWRIHPALPVVCDRLLMAEGNWARNFRQYWRVNDDFRVPRVAAVVPQPPRVSSMEPIQVHLLAFENHRMPDDHMAHLIDIWATSEALPRTGRTFVSRKAAMCPRTFTVKQIGALLQLDELMDAAKQVVVLFSLRNGGRRLSSTLMASCVFLSFPSWIL